jgi:RND family efflux transporter MFP subunit
VKLAPLQPGRLAAVLVAEGDRVRAGQILARLDLTPLRDAAAQAEAQLSQARAQAANAATKLRRAREAFDAGVAAGQEVDDARLGDEAARAAVRTAEAQLSTARNQLARGELRAPFEGVVAKLSAAAGEPVDPSKPVVEVARVDALELRAPVAQRVAMQLRAGQQASVELEGRSFPAMLIAISPVIDPATGAALARVRVANAAFALKANAAARARITVDRHAGVLCVPKAAVLAGPAIETVDGGKAKRVDVQTGYDDGSHVELTAGAKEGDPVIVQGAYALPDGTEVVEAASDGGTPPERLQ